MTLSLLIAVATMITLTTMSVVTGRKLIGARLVPMQWGLDGRPSWSAPRSVALAFTPALAATTLTLMMFPTVVVPHAMGVWYFGVTAVICIFFIAVHATYLGAISRPAVRS
ncbi:hypothetical protein [Tanticharoenia sakaeratensis]|uniref:Uncharacterized protein n=1 Tax=Tanticharoenia sakaeratensis NBRC 103193 TaxID=1231623 RepID=A0A0D6MK98_9PROT|nr:hypothetical protein [Tanticharoenia sakaeratensis]GAN53865.1 hypothetical protein Tasa_012_041 [Tanticharoenia sakaeratensis NBRC 103193]GBQ25117.1 hypothetical protein AA103193_2972 [Tanticharoenia sakaeratensis NBRC 103193]